jgi:hypothetical protein
MSRCPGPGRASECEHRACRYGGCQGRTPGQDWRDPLSWVERLTIGLIGILGIIAALA